MYIVMTDAWYRIKTRPILNHKYRYVSIEYHLHRGIVAKWVQTSNEEITFFHLQSDKNLLGSWYIQRTQTKRCAAFKIFIIHNSYMEVSFQNFHLRYWYLRMCFAAKNNTGYALMFIITITKLSRKSQKWIVVLQTKALICAVLSFVSISLLILDVRIRVYNRYHDTIF